MSNVVLSILLPLLAAMAVGYAWVRTGRPFDNTTLAPLAADLALPCLIFSTLVAAQLPVETLAQMALASFVALCAFAAIGALLLRMAGLELRTYLPSVTWGNAGYLGIPLGLYAFGQPGLAYAAAFSAVSLVFNSVFASTIAAGRASLRAFIRNPILLAVFAGVAVRLAEVEPPRWLLEPVRLFGAMAVPLTLMMVGASLARLRITALPLALGFSVARSAVGIGVALAAGMAFGLPDIGLAVLVLQCATPVAMLSYVLAQRHGNEPERIAAIVAVSTWAGVITIPAMLAFMPTG
ncbi:hypothetical protein DFH01_13280 [Falsiroseomonas bella]|uniref:Transporter n=1 Tax=Falsiroseomonas bella TaxID=2184016 RepID=A0A317FAL4_9PROT|nr:AEC family transporter [Falsiroseomonas bella]PWS36170.1 hypothetical protein DFH01_13280 [Falsiroseomonas bella]